MRCDKPFVWNPTLNRKHLVLYGDEAKQAALPLPCGKCLHCRINKARVWQTRMLLESMVHERNCFVSITYDDDHLPDGRNLIKSDLQKFLKRLRYYLNRKFRYFACGEYGSDKGRPHYHLALFGVGVEDEINIMKAWDKGFATFSGLGIESARYISGYIVKGHNFDECEALKGREKEFQIMSKGLGREIAKRVQEKGHDKYIRELNFGKSRIPLGRYLTEIANAGKDKVKQKALDDYMEEVFEVMPWEGHEFVKNFQELTRVEREQKRKRNQIFKRKGEL